MGWHTWEQILAIASPETVEAALREAEALGAEIRTDCSEVVDGEEME
jgi:hypothetical protein